MTRDTDEATSGGGEALSTERVEALREKAVHQSIFVDMRENSETALALIAERQAVREGLRELLELLDYNVPNRELIARLRRLLDGSK